MFNTSLDKLKNISQNIAISLFAGVAGAYGFSYFSENSTKNTSKNDNLNPQITGQNTPNVRNTGANISHANHPHLRRLPRGDFQSKCLHPFQ